MNTTQKTLIIIALAAVAGLYFLGDTVGKKPAAAATEANHDDHDDHGLDFEKMKQTVFSQLSTDRQQYISGLENSVKRGDVKAQQIEAFQRLSAFWKDSVQNPVLHYDYAAQASELDNSEKSLTFAAHSILAYLPYAHNQEEQVWLANRGKQLFDKALAINPSNDSTNVGVGGCIIYGATSTEGPMAGIMKVRAVAEKDSTNLFAQYMLGVGGVVSGQYDKAALRFERVVKGQPDNLEVMFKLAEAYEMANQTDKAIACYETIEKKVDVPEMKMEIKKRIEQLKASSVGK
ncbi:MAG TPA: tetratricopeptide repeat protein [Phnomibacter sp.]|nr:tetratricopeptide repeat protein [Phnomibacter sp.]